MNMQAQRLLDVCEGTWPPARVWRAGPWTIRDGQGGGKRVSAATAEAPFENGDISVAVDAMREIGQRPLFMIREGDEALDAALDVQGYNLIDSVNIFAAPIESLTDKPIPRVTAFTIWEPLAIMAEIWAQGGVGPDRLAVMRRAEVKTAVLSRWNEKPGGVAYVGVHDGVAMVHAVEVLAQQRRQGVAEWLMRAAAIWAKERGAREISVLCVAENAAANALYHKLGFAQIGRYHYRQNQE